MDLRIGRLIDQFRIHRILILTIKSELLAIEHTRLHINNSKAQEAEWKRLMISCQNKMQERGLLDYIIRIKPNNKFGLTKNRKTLIAKELNKIILGEINRVNHEKITIADNPFPEITSVKAFKRTGPFLITFDSREWWSNATITAKLLIDIIRKKSNRIAKIDTTNYGQTWLLVVLEGEIFSDSPKLDKTKIIPAHLNKFDKIFLLHLGEKWFQEIKNYA